MKSIIIHDWMLRDPKLIGYKLLIFATVYHFTSLGSGCFMTVKSWLNLLHCSRSQFFKARNELISSNYLLLYSGSGVLFCHKVPENIPPVEVESITENVSDSLLSWEELMEQLCDPVHPGESDNETAESDNETAESDNETLPY